MLKFVLLLFSLGSVAAAQDQRSTGFDTSQLDPHADPCVDFYQYACGGWLVTHPLPPSKPRFNRYEEMNEGNVAKIRGLLESASSNWASGAERQVGDYYAACMDEAAVEKKRAHPLDDYMKRIAALSDKKSLLKLMAELDDRGIPMLFEFSASPDLHNVSLLSAEVDQGGLSLPDRDYYSKTDAKTTEQRAKFVEHMAHMFSLLGESPEKAAADAKTILDLETQLAKVSMDRTARRDPQNLDHKMSVSQFAGLAPNLDFANYARATGAPQFSSLNVNTPDFFRHLSVILDSVPLDQWKTYVRWRLVRRMARVLSLDFVNEDFHFNGQYMRGTKELEPRWKRCVRAVDFQLGEASGKLFVDKYFGQEGKRKVQQIVANVMAQLGESITKADWMSEQTKQKALVKLTHINSSKLGFPERYRDYGMIVIKRADYAGNVLRASHFESQRQIRKIGTAVDKTEWQMTPPTVNAYYEPQLSEIVLPAGILQPPMFDLTADDAYSYGAIGRVIGHELTHGFDDEGRKFDADGNLTDWWTPSDARTFEERAACIDKQYSRYSPVDDGNGNPLYLNGKLTLGENVADNGGLRMAYAAYFKSQEGKEQKVVDGFTPEQRVFLGYAISRCENVSPEMSRVLVATDPHSPGKFRLIGPIVNMPEFQQAFSCKTGQPMAPEMRCKVW